MNRSSWAIPPAVLAIVLGAAGARAEDTDEFGPTRETPPGTRVASEQDMAVEIRFGPYRPRVDTEFNGRATPYTTVFGDSTRYILGVELDYQALRIPHFGSLGPGFGWGYTASSGKGLLVTGAPSDQDVTLSIMPMYAVGVLRVDVLARETPVPLVFYAKAGLGYALWWVTSGDKLARADGEVGADSSYGYQAALGGMFLLNALDQTSAIEMDNSVGINASYLFMEYYMSNLNGFGDGKLQVGTNTWVAGLAFEF